MFNPKEREIIKYSPPPSTFLLVAISDNANAVGTVTRCPINMIIKTPQKPKVPTAYPNLKNNIAPSMVEIAVKYTGAVPKPFLFAIIILFVYYTNVHLVEEKELQYCVL